MVDVRITPACAGSACIVLGDSVSDGRDIIVLRWGIFGALYVAPCAAHRGRGASAWLHAEDAPYSTSPPSVGFDAISATSGRLECCSFAQPVSPKTLKAVLYGSSFVAFAVILVGQFVLPHFVIIAFKHHQQQKPWQHQTQRREP